MRACKMDARQFIGERSHELVLAEKKLTYMRKWLEAHICKMRGYSEKIEKMRGEAKT